MLLREWSRRLSRKRSMSATKQRHKRAPLYARPTRKKGLGKQCVAYAETTKRAYRLHATKGWRSQAIRD